MDENEGWEGRIEIWAEEKEAEAYVREREEMVHIAGCKEQGDHGAQEEPIHLQTADHWNCTGTWRKLSI